MAATSRHHRFDTRTRAELITLIGSIIVLAVIIGGLVALELRRGDAPARISATPDFSAVYQDDDDAWYLPVTFTNDGDQAAGVIRVALVRESSQGEPPETTDLEYQYIAGGEQFAGTAVFSEEPTPDNISVDVVSITEP